MKTTKKFLAVFLSLLTIMSLCSVAFPVFAEEIQTSENVVSEDVRNEETTYILSEVIDKREETVKHFLMSDGTYKVAYYNFPVHYKSDDGQWIDYDNSLIEQPSTHEEAELFGDNRIIRTSNSKTNVVFAKKSNSNTLVSYENESFPISFNFRAAKNQKAKIVYNNGQVEGDKKFLTLSNISSQIIYENIFADVDLQYTVNPIGIKENIVLKSSSAQNTFTVNYDIGSLNAVQADKNTILLVVGDKTIYTISAPVMYDASGEICSNIQIEVEKNKNGKLSFSLTADREWLIDPNRCFPVVVDPTIYNGSSDSLEASYVSSANPSVNYSDSTDNLVISANTASENGESYVLLDLSSVSTGWLYDRIHSANLSLPIVSNSETSTRVDAHKITSAWTHSEVSWDNKPSYDTHVLDYCNIGVNSSTLNFDISKLFMDITNGDEENNGILLKIAQGCMTVSATSQNPVLTFDCSSSLGVDSSYSYNEYDMGTAGTVYINNLTGNLVLLRDELSTLGDLCPFSLTSAYNTRAVAKDSDSLWWRNYQSGFNIFSIYYDDDGSSKLYKRDEHGKIEENEAGWNKLEITDYHEIKITIFGREVTLLRIPIAFNAWKYNGTEKYSFNLSGLQSKYIDIEPQNNPNGTLAFSRETIVDENNNPIDGSFNIVDADGKKLRILKSDSQYSVTQIDFGENGTPVEKDKIVQTFDANGNLTSITLNNQIQASFTYDALNRMTSVTDDSNHKLEIGYGDSSRRVTSVKESVNGIYGQQISIERTYSSATVRRSGGDGVFNNDDDTFTEYRFNSDDVLVSERSYTLNGEDLGAISYEHENSDATDIMGTVSKIAASGKIAENLLRNHNMETDGSWTAKTIDDNDCSYSASRVTNDAYSGTASLKITVNSLTKGGGAGYYQLFAISEGVVKPGKFYRASAFIKTDGLEQSANAMVGRAYGAAIMVRVVKSDGTSTRTYSENVQKTDTAITDGWQRVSVGFTVPNNATKVTVYLVVRNATGTAYFDAAQLEEGDYYCQYNMLENPSFTYVNSNGYSEGWTRDCLTSSDKVENGEMKIAGNPTVNKGIYQQITLKDAQQEDKYVLSGIARAQAVPANESSRFYGIHATVYYKETDPNGEPYSAQKILSPFNTYYNGVQYICGGFDLAHPTDENLTPDKLRLDVCYYGQANTAYFDSVCLVRSNDVYDLKAQTESNTEAEDAESSYTYDENGNILTYTDENGKVYTYTYNEFGDLVSCLTPDGKGDRYTYQLYDSDGDEKNDASLPLTEIYEDGTTVTYTYFDNHEIKTETTVCDSVTTVLTYNTDGQLITEATTSDNDSTVTYTYTYTYDADGNLLTKLTEDGVGDRYTYCSFDLNNDGLNDKTEILTEMLEDGSQNSYNYNNKGILTGETKSKNGKSLSYTYDENGNTTSVTHNSFSYNYEYDDFGNTKSVAVGSQPLVTYDYQPEGRLSSTTYGNGSKETYTYNAYGLLNSKSQSGLGSFSWRYDALGRLYYLRDNVNSRKTYYSYDNSNRLVGQHIYSTERSNAYDNFLFSADTAYGTNGNISKTSITAGKKTDKVYYTFNEQGLNTQTKFTNVRKVDFTYGEDGNLTGKTTSTDTPITETFSYYTSGAIENHTINSDTYSYTYYDNGNIRGIQKNEAIVQSYEYDDDNQLVRENDAEAGKTVTFTYDNGGNITSKSEYAYTLVPTEELVNPQSTKTYSYDGIWKDKLTNYNGQSITYDNVGNPTNYMGATMTWFGRQMQSYAKDGTSITYQYDENGLRTQKNVNGTEHEYFYSDGLLRYEKKAGEYELFYRYDAKGIPVSIVRTRFSDGKVHKLYVVTNTRGDVIELRNGDGTMNTKYTYDAWGKLISMTDATGAALSQNTFGAQNSLRYRGYVYDRETRLYYLQSRYYDPEMGRFLNADDVKTVQSYSKIDFLSKNMFIYCRNLPIDLFDSTGNSPEISMQNIGCYMFSYILAYQMFYDYIKDITIQLDSERCADRQATVKDTKGCIVVDFSNGLAEHIYSCYKNNKERKQACYFLAIIARSEFRIQFANKYNKKYKKIRKNGSCAKGYQKPREFLFSQDGVTNEIYQHFLGYAWSIGKNVLLPRHMYVWAVNNNKYEYLSGNYSAFWKHVRSDINGATVKADITEADVYYNNGYKYPRTSEAYWYDYFNNISDVYKNTNFDPYYNTKTKERSKKNDMKDWLGWQLYEK